MVFKSSYVLSSKINKIVLSCYLVLCAFQVNAATVTESVDFDNIANFSPSGESDIGLLDSGVNTISGSLSGSCEPGDCNISGKGDTQDSFLIEIASGYTVDSIYATTSNVYAPDGYSSSLSVYKDTFPNNVLFTGIPNNASSGALSLAEVDAGLYSISVYGQSASFAGEYSLDWSLQINVSAVPVPPAIWLFGSGLVGLIGIARRKKA